MEGKERLQDYLIAVAGCIRWKRARAPLLRELSDHIEDQKKDFSALGMNEDESMERSINEMGDPVAVGKELDRLHRPKTSWGLILFAVLAVSVGFSVLSMEGSRGDFLRQLLGLSAALPVVIFVALSDYTLLIRKKWLLVMAWGLLFFYLLLSTRYAPYNGSRSLIAYGATLLPPLFALVLCHLRGKGWGAFLLCVLAIAPLTATALMAPNIVTAALILTVMTIVMCAAVWMGWFRVSRPLGLFCACGPLLSGILFYLYATTCTPYLTYRLSSFFHPELDPLISGFDILRVREFLTQIPFFNATGELIPATGAPFDDPQFILFSLAARFGWVIFLLAGLLALLTIFVFLKKISKLKSVSGRLVALASGGVLAGQMALGVLLVPLYGLASLPLFPFFSYGPVMLATDLLLVGILLSVFRMDALVRDITEHKSTFTLSIPEQLHIPLGPWDIRINRRE